VVEIQSAFVPILLILNAWLECFEHFRKIFGICVDGDSFRVLSLLAEGLLLLDHVGEGVEVPLVLEVLLPELGRIVGRKQRKDFHGLLLAIQLPVGHIVGNERGTGATYERKCHDDCEGERGDGSFHFSKSFHLFMRRGWGRRSLS